LTRSARARAAARPVAADRPPADSTAFADAIVVAAGSSTRMAGIDKLATVVGGAPLLAHALAAIAAAPEVRRIVVVTAPQRVAAVAAADWLPAAVSAVVAGGARRQDSVELGVAALDDPAAGPDGPDGPAGPDRGDDPSVILVHDGARPLVPTALVSAVARAARLHGAAIPVLAAGDTIKRIATDGTVAGAGDRSTLGAAQTPQGIRSDLLREAFARFPAGGPDLFTDEAALLEACRIPVHAIPGDERNFKVTLPGDLARVEAVLAGVGSGAVPSGAGGLVGLGSDSHPFGPGLGLALGGIVIDHAPRLHGHSDGDVLLHAVADALLGAAGLGDLGRLFPAGPETRRGIASAELLAAVAAKVAARGLAVTQIDCTVVAARPRLAGTLPAIGRRIAEILAIDPFLVNVKASTGNLDGMEGAGRGISATAVAVLGPRPADR
jgi:2-C-methyl-D-erythritol 4-phosphate cytidylyltransferase/2-C-methyl-D-erythritol 2,4-cyclodiphosphate synthase